MWANFIPDEKGGVTLEVNDTHARWGELGEALIMAESLLKMFGHDHQASQVNGMRKLAMRCALMPLPRTAKEDA